MSQIMPYEDSNVSGAMVEIEKSRAVQEVQAALIMAKRFPRDSNSSYSRIIEACKRPKLAEIAMYAFPRGGQTVTGPSIRLAHVLAQNYGNLEFGWRETERRLGSSSVEAYCWDIETNTREVLRFEVPHEMGTKNGTKKLTDPRDIYENIANMGARRLRACILSVIPYDFVEGAREQVAKTLADPKGEPMADRVRKIVEIFKTQAVTLEMLQRRLGHKMEALTPDEIVDLQGIFNSIKEGQAKRNDFFEASPDDTPEEKATDLSSKLRNFKKNEPKVEPKVEPTHTSASAVAAAKGQLDLGLDS